MWSSPPRQARTITRPGIKTCAHPGAVTIEVGGRHIPVRPREAEGPEREALWRLVNDNYNGYQVYQQRAGQRIIPVVLLEPA
jgi:hypothetical protein